MRLSAAGEEQRGARIIESTRRQSNNPLWSTGYGHALLISSLMSAEIIWSRSAPRNATTFFERDLDTMRRLFDQRLFPSPRLLHTHTHPLHTQTVYTNTDIWPPHVFFFPPPPPRSLLNLITANLLAHIGRFGGTRQKCKQQLWRSYISCGSFPIDANRLASAGTWFCCCFFFQTGIRLMTGRWRRELSREALRYTSLQPSEGDVFFLFDRIFSFASSLFLIKRIDRSRWVPGFFVFFLSTTTV